jgi:hypothetical protein
VVSRFWHNGGFAEAGAVTWCSGTTGCAGTISATNSLVGSTTSDQVGYGSVEALSNGNYVVGSTWWNNGTIEDAGAVTWCSGTTGCTGTISAANSLVGSTAYDRIGDDVMALSNDNYVVSSPGWDNGTIEDAGAATWGDGTTGITGVVSSTNSLVGSTINDYVGLDVTTLSNGNYVVTSPNWDNGVTDAGAVTWGNGTTGTSGIVSSINSLVGSTPDDQVGSYGVTLLSNGNYVVKSPYWDNGGDADAGAATWADGTTGVTGTVSSANSLVGSTAGDQVSASGVTALSNGNYVVESKRWDNGGVADAGAVTWANGMTGIMGVVSSTNSLVGSTAGDQVGSSGVTALSNGNYVVSSWHWHNNGASNAGAATWADGTIGVTGTISSANSLVGGTADDEVGVWGTTALSNGNYVVLSPWWDDGAETDAGAVTWGDGATGTSGVVSSTNSLAGGTFGDLVGYNGAVALSNGNYVVLSPQWDLGGATDVGAVTWGNGTTGITGTVSTANSLVGYWAYDQIGLLAGALSNGNYVTWSMYWNNDAAIDAGMVAWGNGMTGTSGVVSSANSLVGNTTDDQVGYYDSVVPLNNGYYIVWSPYWDDGGTADAGAVTLGNGAIGTSGLITGVNSVRGTAAGGGPLMVFAYDDVNNQLVVGRPADNIVTLLANDAPVAAAGDDQEVDTGSTVTLDGSGSSDPDGDLPLTYSWTQTGGPNVSFSPALSITTFTAPSASAVLTFTLVVTDNWGQPSISDDIIVTVVEYQTFLPLILRQEP